MVNRHVLNSTDFSKQSTEEKNLHSEADRLFHVDLTPVRVRSSVLALVGLIHPLTVSVGGKKGNMGVLALVLLPDTGSVGPSLKWLIRQQQYGRTLAARLLVWRSRHGRGDWEVVGGGHCGRLMIHW